MLVLGPLSVYLDSCHEISEAGWYITSVFMRLIFRANTCADFQKRVVIFCTSLLLCVTKKVSSANMSLRTRTYLVIFAELNLITLNKLAPGLLPTSTPWVELVKALDKAIERKIKNSVGTGIQLCFPPFPTLNGSESSLKLTNSFILVC